MLNEQVTVNNAKVGMRIKVALPTKWCQVNSSSKYIWLKGKILEVNLSKKDNSVCGITFSAKWNKHHHYFKIDRMWAPVNKETGEFNKIYKCL